MLTTGMDRALVKWEVPPGRPDDGGAPDWKAAQARLPAQLSCRLPVGLLPALTAAAVEDRAAACTEGMVARERGREGGREGGRGCCCRQVGRPGGERAGRLSPAAATAPPACAGALEHHRPGRPRLQLGPWARAAAGGGLRRQDHPAAGPTGGRRGRRRAAGAAVAGRAGQGDRGRVAPVCCAAAGPRVRRWHRGAGRGGRRESGGAAVEAPGAPRPVKLCGRGCARASWPWQGARVPGPQPWSAVPGPTALPGSLAQGP